MPDLLDPDRDSSSDPDRDSSSDPDSDSSSDASLPELSQLLARSQTSKQAMVDNGLVNGRNPLHQTHQWAPSQSLRVALAVAAEGVTSATSAKPETMDEQLPQTPAVQRSPMKTRSSTRKVTNNSSPGVRAFIPKAGDGKKRQRDAVEDASNVPQASVLSPPITQPSKRARLSQIALPSASQPLPSPISPSKKATDPSQSSAKATQPNRDKGKQKAALRTRHAIFWHLDGSVVVQVQNTLFRLHRSRLSQQSEHFLKLFSGDWRVSTGPNTAEEPEVVDSCPVYVVKGVSVLDFERLLIALDAGIAYAIKPPPFHVLASLVRAAHALQFNTILTFATHLLRELWPQDLKRLSEDPREHALETLLVAQECEVPEVLKRAYYEILRTPNFGQDLAVYVHAETAKMRSPLHFESELDEENAPPPLLSASDFVRLVGAKEALQKEWLTLVCAAPLPSTVPCPLAMHISGQEHGPQVGDSSKVEAAKQCVIARKADVVGWTARLIDNGVFETGMRDTFKGIQLLVEMDWAGMGYCVGCVGERRELWSAIRERLWRKLDVLLGLKGEDENHAW